jgi:hypothetical protein
MRLSERQRLFSKCFQKLLRFIHDSDWECTIGEVQRTRYQQQRYVDEGKSWTMSSKHLDKCAVDLFLWVEGRITWDHDDYKVLGNYWKTLDPLCVWGGDWRHRDSAHFEIDDG